MSYTQEIKIKLQIENILASESKNFSYTIMLSNDYLHTKFGTFDNNWEGQASFLIDPNKTAITPLTQVLYGVSYNFQGKSYAVASGVIPLILIIVSPIEVKLKNTRETIKSDSWLGKDETVPVFVKEQVVTRQCQHTDGAILIAEYIVNEIKQNVKSETAILIRGRLHSENRLSILWATFINWRGAVETGAEWDHKPKIRDNPQFKKVAVHRPLERGTPSLSYYHKYKNHDYFYDVWSNIHYGYVGLSVGFPKTILNRGASQEQSNAGGGSEDPIDDVTTIDIGYKLYAQFGQNAEGLTAQHVLDALEQCTDKQLPESRKTHWCWNNDNPLRVGRK